MGRCVCGHKPHPVMASYPFVNGMVAVVLVLILAMFGTRFVTLPDFHASRGLNPPTPRLTPSSNRLNTESNYLINERIKS